MRHLLLLSVLLGSTSAFAGQRALVGQVLDRNGEPVARAVVSVTPGNVELVTDTDGRFTIDYLRDDDGARIRLKKRTQYRVEIFKPGFHPASDDVFFPKGLLSLSTFTLTEDTIRVEDDDVLLDPDGTERSTHSSGATYEGQ